MHPVHDDGTFRYLRFIAANVRAQRRRVGWTQEQLAEAADLDLRFLQRIERGTTNLSIVVLVAIAEAFGELPESFLRPATLAPARPGRPPSPSATSRPDDDADFAPPSRVRPKHVRPKRARAQGKRS